MEAAATALEEAQKTLADQEEEVRITEARIEALKLQVAGCITTGDVTTPTGSTISTLSTGLQLSDALERAISEMRMRPGKEADSTEASPDDPLAKKPRNTVSVDLSPPMMEMWNIFQNAVKTAMITQLNTTAKEEGARAGEQDVLMLVIGE